MQATKNQIKDLTKPWGVFEEQKKFNFYSYNDKYTYISSENFDREGEGRPIMEWNFYEDDLTDIFEREVVTLASVISEIGGFVEIVVITITVLVSSS